MSELLDFARHEAPMSSGSHRHTFGNARSGTPDLATLEPPCRATVALSVRRQVSRKSPAAQVALPRTRRPPRLWPAQRPLIGRWVRQERPVDTWLSARRPPLVRLDATDPRRRSDLGLARPR